MFRVLICGSRTFSDYDLLRDDLKILRGFHTDITVVEGCARGADRLAERAARDLGLTLEHHPADWNLYGRSAGYKRNVEMLESGVQEVWAYWDGESRGTAHTIGEAQKRNIPTAIRRSW